MQCELQHHDPREKRNVKLLHMEENFLVTKEQIKDIHEQLGHPGKDKLKRVILKLDYNANRNILKKF